MTTEIKTEIKKVTKTVEVDEKTPVVVHTLPLFHERSRPEQAYFTPTMRMFAEAAAFNLDSFPFGQTTEGYDFWFDVFRRLSEIAKLPGRR